MQKRIHYTLILCFVITLGLVNMSCSRATEPAFHHNGVPTKQLNAVFTDLGVSVDSLEQANEFAQKNLLRSGERWDVQEDNELHTRMRDNQAALIDDVRAFGMIDATIPTKKVYTYALLMGATTGRVTQRLEHLVDLIKDGYTFKYIALLGGERPLRDVEKEGLPETVTTEAQMMEYVCSRYPELADYNVILVNAPMIQKPDGTFARPTTDNTLVYFAEIAPEDGSCLVISNNPYTVRQTKVTQRILDQSRFPTQGAGPALSIDKVGIIMLMDEFARTLYEENLRFKSGK